MWSHSVDTTGFPYDADIPRLFDLGEVGGPDQPWTRVEAKNHMDHQHGRSMGVLHAVALDLLRHLHQSGQEASLVAGGLSRCLHGDGHQDLHRSAH